MGRPKFIRPCPVLKISRIFLLNFRLALSHGPWSPGADNQQYEHLFFKFEQPTEFKIARPRPQSFRGRAGMRTDEPWSG